MNDNLQQRGKRGFLNKGFLARTFQEKGSKIKHADLFTLSARMICVEERDYLGLLGLDTVLQNRQGRYRKDKVTPDTNHQLDINFQKHMFKANDDLNPSRDFQYLPDYLRPDLMSLLIFLHDEGEDQIGFTKDYLELSLHQFLYNIDKYVDLHNTLYSMIHLPRPTSGQIREMHSDISLILKVFDRMTKSYQGQPDNQTYFEYCRNIIGFDNKGHFKNMPYEDKQACAIASVLKLFDKNINSSTVSVRNQKMIEAMVDGNEIAYLTEKEKTYKWSTEQIAQTHNVFFDRAFSSENLSSEFSALEETGFINAMVKHHPETENIGRVMGDVLKLGLRIYRYDLAEKGNDLDSMPINYPEYDSLVLSPRFHLLNITRDRLIETRRIDEAGQDHPRNEGMFGVKFPEYQRTQKPQPIPFSHLPTPVSFVQKHRL